MTRGEFEIIADIRKRFSNTRRPVVGIGDDAAVIDHNLLVTTDALVEGVHFVGGKIDYNDLGYKSLAVNLSDVAAMGGEALYSLITLGMPEGFPDSALNAFMDGVGSISDEYGVDLIGGDLVRSATLFVSVTLIGRAIREPFLRSGAKPGDTIYVTGTLGDSAAGLALELGKLKYPVADEAFFRARHYRPTPRLKAAKYLAENFTVHACIDVSDGFLADLGHICEESGAGFDVDLDKLPLSLERIGESIHSGGRYFYELAAGGGEDYELILTSPETWDEGEFIKRTGVKITKVGKITSDGRTIRFRGETVDPSEIPAGYKHV